jgi:predicted Zn-dependent protease
MTRGSPPFDAACCAAAKSRTRSATRAGDGVRTCSCRELAGAATVTSRSTSELLAEADGGLFFPEADRGYLDPLSGTFTLHFPYGRRIQDQTPGEPVGPCSLRAHVHDLLSRVAALGREARPAGAGWCAKDGIRMPVWATAPEMRLDSAEILP